MFWLKHGEGPRWALANGARMMRLDSKSRPTMGTLYATISTIVTIQTTLGTISTQNDLAIIDTTILQETITKQTTRITGDLKRKTPKENYAGAKEKNRTNYSFIVRHLEFALRVLLNAS